MNLSSAIELIMKIKNLNRYTISLLVLLTIASGSLVQAGVSVAKMTYKPTSLAEVPILLKALKSKGKLNDKEIKQLLLLSFLKDLVRVEEFRVSSKKYDDPLKVLEHSKLSDFEYALEDEVDSKVEKYWKLKFPPEIVAKVTKERKLLLSITGSKSYLWSWFIQGLGESSKAKENLMRVFEKEYAHFMNIKKRTFSSPRKGLLHRLKIISRALEVISTKEEIEVIKERMRKAKTHLSNIPNLNIMT